MFFMLVVMTLSLTFLSFADPHWLRDTNAILAFPFSIGVVRSIGSIIPPALLSDIIDYDELQCECTRYKATLTLARDAWNF